MIIDSAFISASGTIGATPASGSIPMTPAEEARALVNEVKAWAQRGVSDARSGSFKPKQASLVPGWLKPDFIFGPEGTAGASVRFDSWLTDGRGYVDKLTALQGRATNQETKDYLNKGIQMVVDATGPKAAAVMNATDVGVLTRLILHIDQGVQLLGAGIGAALNWTASKIIVPVAIAAVGIGAVYLGIQSYLVKKAVRSNPSPRACEDCVNVHGDDAAEWLTRWPQGADWDDDFGAYLCDGCADARREHEPSSDWLD